MSSYELQGIKRALDEQTAILKKILKKLEEVENHAGTSVDALMGIETNTGN